MEISLGWGIIGGFRHVAVGTIFEQPPQVLLG